MNLNTKTLFLISTLIISACAGTAEKTGGKSGESSGYYFCYGSRLDETKFYFTHVLQGAPDILEVSTQFKSYLLENYRLMSKSVNCRRYGKETNPQQFQLAEKLWKTEMLRKGPVAKIIILDWTPE